MPSIYQRICAEYRKTGELPYSFMPGSIGATSITAMQSNQLPRNLREVCARKTWDAIFADGPWSIIEPIWFAPEFRQEVLRRIGAGEITADETAAKGMRLCRDSDLTQAVEAGMILMGMRYDDFTAQVMERLALHSKFTQIAVTACRDWPDENGRIFRWLQNTAGCGNLVCALSLRPENDAQRAWLFYHGLEFAQPQAEMARCILARPSMAEFIRRLPNDAQTFHALCRLVSYAPELTQAQANEYALLLLRGMEFADQYIDLCAIHRMGRMLLLPADALYMQWRDRCEPIRRRLREKGVIPQEMNAPTEDAALLCMVLNGERMTPPLELLTRLLATQELPDAMLRFFLLEHDRVYAEALLECMLRVSPKVIFDDPPTVKDAREYPEGKYDIWLARALGAMCGDFSLEEGTVLRCIEARLAAVRYQAVRCLAELIADPLSEAAEQALHRAISQEPDEKLRRQMQALLNGMNPVSRARIHADVDGIDPDIMRTCLLGDRLLYAEIISRENYNADGMAHLLQEGDRLILTLSDTDADAAWAVTPGGVVVGEVDLSGENAVLKRLLEDGQPLLAVLENGGFMDRMWVDIRRPLRDVYFPMPANLRPFPNVK